MKHLYNTVSMILISLWLLPTIVHATGSEVDTGTTAWMMMSVALVLLMIPGLAMFYGGLVRTKNVLSTMMHSYVALAIIGVCGWQLERY